MLTSEDGSTPNIPTTSFTKASDGSVRMTLTSENTTSTSLLREIEAVQFVYKFEDQDTKELVTRTLETVVPLVTVKFTFAPSPVYDLVVNEAFDAATRPVIDVTSK